jgi:subtilisin family serine protease
MGIPGSSKVRDALPVVVVFDGGVDHSHTDLDDAMWRNPGEIADDGLDNDGNGYVDDVFGAHVATLSGEPFQGRFTEHGTHVAGIIAAEDNLSGNTGIAAGRAEVMSVSGIFEGDPIGATERAVDYVLRMKQEYGVNVRVLNVSWGIERPRPDEVEAYERIFRKLADADILVVAATSNSGRDTDGESVVPAYLELPNVITVAAMDRNNDKLFPLSSFGATEVDIAAPGENILSTVPSRPPFLNPHHIRSGASMAAPHVAGAAALLFEANPQLTAIEVRDILLATAAPDPDLVGKVATGGKLDVSAALHCVRVACRG